MAPDIKPVVLSAAAFEKIAPEEFYKRFVQNNVRPDGRSLERFRPTSLQINSVTTANGSAVVRLGNTMVVCGIKAEVAEPRADAPNLGYIVPNVELAPICSPQFKAGPPGELSQAIGHQLNRILDLGKVLKLDQLCIEEHQAVWCLYADVTCLTYEGNILDAALLALMAALTHMRLPQATLNEDTGVVTTSLTDDSTPLVIDRPVYAATFAMFPDQVLLADPTDTEEAIAEALVSVVLDDQGRQCCIWTHGTQPQDYTRCTERLLTLAQQRTTTLQSLVTANAPQS
ncbi:hypothetical protein H4R34_003279 [Dimargaris verticillata]|uniref:Ribosomal RNA-processing protein 43 n=1 Tax=Dimargaris verticillata TaxID=2761393 RepID=A0A9W8B6J1_9FUNG|nr:hypothetical protein H4R34_003279 [Dimargaris verticillata]